MPLFYRKNETNIPIAYYDNISDLNLPDVSQTNRVNVRVGGATKYIGLVPVGNTYASDLRVRVGVATCALATISKPNDIIVSSDRTFQLGGAVGQVGNLTICNNINVEVRSCSTGGAQWSILEVTGNLTMCPGSTLTLTRTPLIVRGNICGTGTITSPWGVDGGAGGAGGPGGAGGAGGNAWEGSGVENGAGKPGCPGSSGDPGSPANSMPVEYNLLSSGAGGAGGEGTWGGGGGGSSRIVTDTLGGVFPNNKINFGGKGGNSLFSGGGGGNNYPGTGGNCQQVVSGSGGGNNGPGGSWGRSGCNTNCQIIFPHAGGAGGAASGSGIPGNNAQNLNINYTGVGISSSNENGQPESKSGGSGGSGSFTQVRISSSPVFVGTYQYWDGGSTVDIHTPGSPGSPGAPGGAGGGGGGTGGAHLALLVCCSISAVTICTGRGGRTGGSNSLAKATSGSLWTFSCYTSGFPFTVNVAGRAGAGGPAGPAGTHTACTATSPLATSFLNDICYPSKTKIFLT